MLLSAFVLVVVSVLDARFARAQAPEAWGVVFQDAQQGCHIACGHCGSNKNPRSDECYKDCSQFIFPILKDGCSSVCPGSSRAGVLDGRCSSCYIRLIQNWWLKNRTTYCGDLANPVPASAVPQANRPAPAPAAAKTPDGVSPPGQVRREEKQLGHLIRCKGIGGVKEFCVEKGKWPPHALVHANWPSCEPVMENMDQVLCMDPINGEE